MAFSPSQRKSLAAGIGLLLAAAAVVVLVWWGSYLPGFAGEFFSMVAGIFWTPVLLDISLFVIGLGLVMWLNKVRLARDGDEYVYLEQVDDPSIPDDLPPEVRSAVYSAPPAPPPELPEIAAIEGALAMGDDDAATELLLNLDEEELALPEVLALRCELARRHGRHEDVAALTEKLRLSQPDHPLCGEAGGG
jgi:hypothetical protein